MKKILKLAVLFLFIFNLTFFLVNAATWASSFRLNSDNLKYNKWDEFNVDLLLNTWWEEIIWFKASISYNTWTFLILNFDDNGSPVNFWADKQIDKDKWEINLSWWFPWGYKANDEVNLIKLVFKVVNDKKWVEEISIIKEKSTVRKNSDLIENVLWNISNVVMDFNLKTNKDNSKKPDVKKQEVAKTAELEKITKEISKIKEDYKKRIEQKSNLASSVKKDKATSILETWSGAETVHWSAGDELEHSEAYKELDSAIKETGATSEELKVSFTSIIWVQILFVLLLIAWFIFYLRRRKKMLANSNNAPISSTVTDTVSTPATTPAATTPATTPTTPTPTIASNNEVPKAVTTKSEILPKPVSDNPAPAKSVNPFEDITHLEDEKKK